MSRTELRTDIRGNPRPSACNCSQEFSPCLFPSTSLAHFDEKLVVAGLGVVRRMRLPSSCSVGSLAVVGDREGGARDKALKQIARTSGLVGAKGEQTKRVGESWSFCTMIQGGMLRPKGDFASFASKTPTTAQLPTFRHKTSLGCPKAAPPSAFLEIELTTD